jgi:hypothetical protein
MHEISPSQLAARCRNIQPDASHEPFCFELVRRAIVEGSSLCWHYLHNQYYSLVRYWVSRRAPSDPDTIDDLTQNVFTLPAYTLLPEAPALVYTLAMGEDGIPKWLALRITLGYTV